MPLPLHRAVPRPRLRPLVAAVALALTGASLVASPVEAAPRNRAVALGDSYASGEGLAPYRAGTDTTTNHCHRSPRAYPELLDEGWRPAVRRIRSVACSGAVTGDVVADLRPGDDVAAQIDALSRRTRTVTLTIGGNDVGFADVLGACTYTTDPTLQLLVRGQRGCNVGLDLPVTAATAVLAGTAPTEGRLSLAQVLVSVHQRAPRAKVYVTGYPRLLGLAHTDDQLGCQVGTVADKPLYISRPDVEWIRSKADGLNAALRQGVDQARALGVRATYVDVANAFAGHEVCGSRRDWVNGALFTASPGLGVDRASFHPNQRGHRAYARAVAAAIQGYSPRP